MINIPLYPQGSVQMVKKQTKKPLPPKPKTASSLVYAHSLMYKKIKETFKENGWG